MGPVAGTGFCRRQGREVSAFSLDPGAYRDSADFCGRQRRKPVSSSSVSAAAAKENSFLFESLDLAESVRDALQKLPPAQSEVVVLKIWEDMTFLEIGAVLGESPNTAASRYRYALEKLTQHLQPFCNEVPYD